MDWTIQTWTFIIVGLSFAIYIGIAIWSRASSTKDFYVAHGQVSPLANGLATAADWMTKATISIFDKTFIWKYENIWNTKWSVIDSEGNSINYSGDSTSGKIESTLEDDLLLLTGLFVTNYFWQITIVIIFIPMWT